MKRIYNLQTVLPHILIGLLLIFVAYMGSAQIPESIVTSANDIGKSYTAGTRIITGLPKYFPDTVKNETLFAMDKNNNRLFTWNPKSSRWEVDKIRGNSSSTPRMEVLNSLVFDYTNTSLQDSNNLKYYRWDLTNNIWNTGLNGSDTIPHTVVTNTYVNSLGFKEIYTGATLPASATIFQTGNKFLLTTDSTEYTYQGNHVWFSNIVKGTATPTQKVVSGTETFDNSRAVWKNPNISIISGQTVDFTYQSFAWKPTKGFVYVSDFGYNPKTGAGDAFPAAKAAIAYAAANQVDVIFDEGYFNFMTTDSLIVPQNINIRGISKVKTLLTLNASTPHTLFKFINGSAVCFSNSIHDLKIYSNVTTPITAISANDVSDFQAYNLTIQSGVNGGYLNGVGIQIRGRETIKVENAVIYAQEPIKILTNFNNTISLDHTTFKNLTLATDSTHANISIESGVNLTSFTIEGYNTFAGGKYGIYWNDILTSQASYGINFKNIRWEQESYGGYFLYISHNYGLQSLLLENCYGGLHGSFLYARNVTNINLRGCIQPGNTVTAINSVATNTTFSIVANNWYHNSPNNLTGYLETSQGNYNSTFTSTLDVNKYSNTVYTNTTGLGVGGVTADATSVLVANSLQNADQVYPIRITNPNTATKYRGAHILATESFSGTYLSAFGGERDDIGNGWWSNFRATYNTANAPTFTTTGLSTAFVCEGRFQRMMLYSGLWLQNTVPGATIDSLATIATNGKVNRLSILQVVQAGLQAATGTSTAIVNLPIGAATDSIVTSASGVLRTRTAAQVVQNGITKTSVTSTFTVPASGEYLIPFTLPGTTNTSIVAASYIATDVTGCSFSIPYLAGDGTGTVKVINRTASAVTFTSLKVNFAVLSY